MGVRLQLTQDEKDKLYGVAVALHGLPYVFGSEIALPGNVETLRKKNCGMDCSELVEFAFRQLGYKVPDGSYNQYDASSACSAFETLQVGDLVFKQNEGRINHVGIIIVEDPAILVEAEGVIFKRVVFTPLKRFIDVPSTWSQYAGMRRFLIPLIKKV